MYKEWIYHKKYSFGTYYMFVSVFLEQIFYSYQKYENFVIVNEKLKTF